jgi:hypothetical protein
MRAFATYALLCIGGGHIGVGKVGELVGRRIIGIVVVAEYEIAIGANADAVKSRAGVEALPAPLPRAATP